MGLVTPWPSVRQALVRHLRSNLVLAAGLPGDWSEGFAPQKTDYPLGVYALHYSPSAYDWSGRVVFLGIDVVIFSKDQGEAASLYSLVFSTLQDAKLTLAGQTSLQCRQTSDISLQDMDTEGKAIYETGGVFEVRVSQSTATLATLTVTADSTIS